MEAIGKVIYQRKIKTVKAFKTHCRNNRIKMPSELIARRRLFIEWYLKEHSTISIESNISDLSKYYLYISERTIEETLFNDEPTRKPY